MRIYIYYCTTDKPWGGSNSFVIAFKNYLKNKKRDSVQIVSNINKDYDIFLIIGGLKGQGIPITIKEIEKLKKYGSTSFIGKMVRKNKKKIICRLDGLRAIYINKFDPIMDTLQLKVSDLADHIIFQSRHCLESFRNFGYNKANYTIIKNGVDQTIFNLQNKGFWNKKDKLRVFSAGWSRNPLKGYSTIAEFSENEGVESYFVGRWPDEINSKNVICLPPMTQTELSEHYKKCDVYLHPAKNDPCPNVVLEAMATRTFVIVSNVKGNNDVIKHNESGLLFNYNKIDFLKQLYRYRNKNVNVNMILDNAINELSNNYDIKKISDKLYFYLKSKL